MASQRKGDGEKAIRWREVTRSLITRSPPPIIAYLSLGVGIVSVVITILLAEIQSPDAVVKLFIYWNIGMLSGLVGLVVYLAFRSERYKLISQFRAELSEIISKHHEDTYKNVIKDHEEYIELLQQCLSDQHQHAYLITHRYRDIIFKHFQPLVLNEPLIEFTEEDLDLFEKILFFITGSIRASFQNYFRGRRIDINEDLAITVKLIIPSELVINLFRNSASPVVREEIKREEQWVITVFRDPYTYEKFHDQREVRGKKLYNIGKNTAFHTIVTNHQSCFCCNDLQSLGDSYKNENVNWKKFYNSTLVVPIRYQLSEITGEYNYFGFLAVDSLNKKGLELYDDKECRAILSHAANLLSNFFLSLALLKYPQSPVEANRPLTS